jgi:alpha-D-ribose 1-methylphosphonate 5-triphosphate synthase subunit PhnH
MITLSTCHSGRGGFNDEDHSQAHHGNNDTERIRKIAAITKFNIDQFTYVVNKMHSLREGDGTLLTGAGIPLNRPIGIATKQLTEMVASCWTGVRLSLAQW